MVIVKGGKASGKGNRASIGKPGTGVAIELNGKTRYFRVTNTNLLLEISGSGLPLKTNDLSSKEYVKRVIDNGKGTFISKSEVNERINKLREERANKPDYELGNPFGERGRGKTVYRPRRQR